MFVSWASIGWEKCLKDWPVEDGLDRIDMLQKEMHTSLDE